MTSITELKSLNRQKLAELARELDIAGRSSMSKELLIEAIQKAQESARRKKPTSTKPIDTALPTEESKPKRSKAAKSVPATAKPSATAAKSTANPKAVKAVKTPAEKSSPPEPTASKRAATKTSAVKPVEKKVDKADTPATPTSKPAATKTEKSAAKPSEKPKKKAAPKPPPAPPAPVSAKSKRIREEMRRRSQAAQQNKDLSTGVLVAGSAVRGSVGETSNPTHKDRVVLIVRDSYWLQAEWEITRSAVERVRVAMNEKWHHAVPVLRLMSVGDASTNRAEQQIRDITIHGGVNTWFIDVESPPSRFRVIVGYLAENDRFYPLCRSNIVETPKPDAVHRLDRHWRDIAEDYERIYSLSGGYEPNSSADLKDMFEERLQRQMPTRSEDTSSSDTDAALDRHRSLPFDVDAELIVYGTTVPGATVLLSGEPLKLRDDGSFTVRVAMPDKRQVLPIIAQSRDGMRQRTTVIAVERNTKVMEAVDRDQNF